MKALVMWAFSIAVLLASFASAQAQKPPKVTASDCETCKKTCPGTCVKHEDSCFCYQRLEPDENKLTPMPLDDPSVKGSQRKQKGPRLGTDAENR